jgi:hypothetical protein
MRPFLALFAALVGLLALGGPAMAIEQPKYTVESKDGDIELRRYAPYIVAEVSLAGDQGETVQRGFRILAGYIFGGNAGRAKIAMTAPVAQQPEGEKIAMTSPVAQTPDGAGRWTVQFMMPSSYTLDTLPKPNDPAIHFRVEPARTAAVLSFSGVAREGNYRERTAQLTRWISAKGLTAEGPAVLAQYDPPWTPWFMRRNEVMVTVRR